MAQTVIEGVTVLPGGGRPAIPDAAVTLDAGGRVTDIAEGVAPAADLLLVPGGVDLHPDNLVERRRPRATVSLDHEAVISVLDVECAPAAIAPACVAPRAAESPRHA